VNPLIRKIRRGILMSREYSEPRYIYIYLKHFNQEKNDQKKMTIKMAKDGEATEKFYIVRCLFYLSGETSRKWMMMTRIKISIFDNRKKINSNPHTDSHALSHVYHVERGRNSLHDAFLIN
jgi:hypothetical protein